MPTGSYAHPLFDSAAGLEMQRLQCKSASRIAYVGCRLCNYDRCARCASSRDRVAAATPGHLHVAGPGVPVAVNGIVSGSSGVAAEAHMVASPAPARRHVGVTPEAAQPGGIG